MNIGAKPAGRGWWSLMEFRLLGTVELWANNRTHVLNSLKLRLAFACLAYEIDQPVSVDILINRLWEDAPPPNARKILYSYISRLRTTLRNTVGADGPRVRQQTNTYVLNADRHTVDAHRYTTLAAQARSLADSGEDEQALRLLDEADALWRGEPLSGLPGLWAEEVRTALTQQSLAVAQIRTDIALRRGHFADIVGSLSALVSRHPTNEALAERLMLSLYGSGQPAEALRVYQDLRHRLVRDFGSEPGHRLRRVHEGILRHAPVADLLPGAATAPHSHPFGGSTPNSLPRRPALVGREAELERIRSALIHTADAKGNVVALEAIAGMAGVGKSALALHAAYELRDYFPDGQLFLNLRAHAGDQAPMTPAAALDTLLRSLGVPNEGIPHDFDEATALWRTKLARRKVLILLDDVADPGQVIPLIPGGDSPSMLITTSRRHLSGIPGQHRIPLDVLPEDDAIALIRQQVGAERTADANGLAELIRLCAQLPLAITLAASRLGSHPSWSVTDFTRRLATSNQRLAELRDSTTGITRVFDFSYQRLNAAQQAAFRLLGLHIGSEFGPHAAASLIGIGLDETEDILEAFLDYSLLEEPAAHRYRMHDLIREYARTLATAQVSEEQRTLAIDRLLDFYLCAADRADRLLYPHRPRIDIDVTDAPHPLPSWPDRSAVRQWFATERMNLLTMAEKAWEVGPPRRAALFANALGGFLDTERHEIIAESIHQRAVAHWHHADDQRAESRALIDLGVVSTHADRYADAIVAGRRSVDLARSTGDSEALAEALHQQAVPYAYLGQFMESLALQREALDIRMSKTDRYQQARSLNNLALTLQKTGDLAGALSYFEAARDGFAANGVEHTWAWHNNLGNIHRDMGNRDQARLSYEAALQICITHRIFAGRALPQMNLAEVLYESGDLDAALALYKEALSTSRHVAEKRNEAISHIGIGTVLRLKERCDEAIEHLSTALEMARQIRAAPQEYQALFELGLTERHIGHVAAASNHLRSALAVAQRLKVADRITEAQRALSDLKQSAPASTTSYSLRLPE